MSSFQSLLMQYQRRDVAGSRAVESPDNPLFEAAAEAADRSFLTGLLALQEQSGADMGALLDLVVECSEVAA